MTLLRGAFLDHVVSSDAVIIKRNTSHKNSLYTDNQWIKYPIPIMSKASLVDSFKN